MTAPKNMTAQQIDWLARMRASLESLHEQWYGRGRHAFDQELFAEVDRKIRAAADKLDITVQDVAEAEERNEGWDGELYGPFVVLGAALDAITIHFVTKAAA